MACRCQQGALIRFHGISSLLEVSCPLLAHEDVQYVTLQTLGILH
jgi:hypothetical protein